MPTTGKISLYVFDPSDPIIQAYQHLFPKLFQPASEMPADLRRHARYPEALFQAQAEAYRTFHMRDPQVFYNKEDIWDIAHNLVRPVRAAGKRAAHLRRGHFAGRKIAGVSADSALHSARQR